jgi:predicted MPP superfamily phosphohydrolase
MQPDPTIPPSSHPDPPAPPLHGPRPPRAALLHPLLEPVDLPFHPLPPQLAGLRILHLTDLHIRRWRSRYRSVIDLIAATPCDLLLLTGDYMDTPGDEPIAHDILTRILATARPTLGTFGVFGNHDTPRLRQRLAHLPVHWLNNQSHHLPSAPLTIVGVDHGKYEHRSPRGDLLKAVTHPTSPDNPPTRRLTILLSHSPTWIPLASHMGIDLILAGHTHGGQCRLTHRFLLFNATPGWPLHHSAGILQSGSALGLISRGLGESMLSLRFLCPPHLPLITLSPAPQPRTPVHGTVVLRKW